MKPFKYLHIGYPKNLSTALQRDFFSKHSQLHHLGVGIESNIDYIDDVTNLVCEDYLLYASNRKYEGVRGHCIRSFQDHFESLPNGKSVVGISCEQLSFKFSPDQIDSELKAQRARDIFGRDTSILIVIRNQADLLKSLYREMVKIGYPEPFYEFIEYCYLFQDRNFVLDFHYDRTYNLYSNLFGAENVHVIPIELFRNPDGDLKKDSDGFHLITNSLCEILGVEKLKFNLRHHNDGLTGIMLEEKRLSNTKNPHDFGLPVCSPVNGHRLEKYFKLDLGVPMPSNIRKSWKNKRTSIDGLKSIQSGASPNLYFDPLIWNRLMQGYKDSNSNLLRMGIELPDVYMKIA